MARKIHVYEYHLSICMSMESMACVSFVGYSYIGQYTRWYPIISAKNGVLHTFHFSEIWIACGVCQKSHQILGKCCSKPHIYTDLLLHLFGFSKNHCAFGHSMVFPSLVQFLFRDSSPAIFSYQLYSFTIVNSIKGWPGLTQDPPPEWFMYSMLVHTLPEEMLFQCYSFPRLLLLIL